MSIALMTEAWKTDMPTGRKFVLLALCDNANDQGECYPSIQRIAGKCSMCERAVQGHLADLEQAGMVVRDIRRGRSTLYRINPRRFCTPAENAPPQILHPTPAESAPITVTEPLSKPSLNRQRVRAHENGDDGGPPENKKPKRLHATTATRISPDWNPTDDDIEFATSAGIEPQDIPAIADRFRDYWLAKPGIDGTKLDWPATWRNWIRREVVGGHGGGSAGGSRRGRRTSADAFAELIAEMPEGNCQRAGLRNLQSQAGCNSLPACVSG